eukprot:12321443-Alexandrium_andersonii.AAC.1
MRSQGEFVAVKLGLLEPDEELMQTPADQGLPQTLALPEEDQHDVASRHGQIREKPAAMSPWGVNSSGVELRVGSYYAHSPWKNWLRSSRRTLQGFLR